MRLIFELILWSYPVVWLMLIAALAFVHYLPLLLPLR
jgi:hypothetical protein